MSGSICRRSSLLAIGLAAAAAALSPAPAAATPALTGVFPVEGVGTNNKLVAGPEGDIWVTLAGNVENVARVTPAGEVKEFELGLDAAAGIAVGPEGKIWIAAEGAVADFSGANPEGTVVATANPAIKGFYSIVAGPEGKIWVATEEVVFRFPPGAPAVPESKSVPGLTPHDIDASGSTVIVADGGAPRIVSFDSAFKETDYSYGAAGGSQGLAAGANGQIAFSDPGATPEQIGLITPPGAALTTEQTGDPFGVAYGIDQAFWFAQFTNGELVRLTATGQKTFLSGLPKESPRQIAAGPGDTLWVTLTKAGEEGVARISGLEPPAAPVVPPVAAPVTKPTPAPAPPQTKIVKGPKRRVVATARRTRVSFRFTSPTVGATFECALTKAKKKGQKAATPHFVPCRSPRSLALKSGAYRFSVRAVAVAVRDPSPATAAFRIVPPRQNSSGRGAKAKNR